MEEELKKVNRENYKELYSSLQIRKSVSKEFSKYAKKNHKSKTEIVEELVVFLYTNDIALNEVWKLKDKMLIPRYHEFTAGFLQNFEKNYLLRHADFQEKAAAKISRLEPLVNYLMGAVQENTNLLRLLMYGAYEKEEAVKITAENKSRMEALKKRFLDK